MIKHAAFTALMQIVAVLASAAMSWPAVSAGNSPVGTWQLTSFSEFVLDRKRPTGHSATIRQDIFSILPGGTWLCSLPRVS